jgi:8-hydroxy-5-deazaflavin:NADPH oxidoreductase
MKIGILGAGNIGSTLARLFTRAGHEVAISNSKSPRSLEKAAQELGPEVRAVEAEEAAAFGDVVVVAFPFKAVPSLGRYALGGKVLIDATNYYPERDGSINFRGGTSSELLAMHAQGAKVVKAFNTMFFKTLGAEGKPDAPVAERLTLFLAGDDDEAKATVTKLIQEIGFAALDTGPLGTGGKRQEPGSKIYNRPMRLEEAKATLTKV